MSTNTVDPPVSHLTPTRKPGETQRLQTLCIEVPVTVQGSRNTHPSTPFLEETRTVIVFPQGAVLRLSEIVVQGQILIVQNMRVKQEVACRVISSKPGATAKGYVELEFTQPAPGFWGISFPGEAIAPRPVVPEATTEVVTAPVASTPIPTPPVAQPSATPMASAEIAMPLSPMHAPAKLTPETTLELNAAIAASFANLREAVMKPETSESAKPTPVERKEPAARPVVETSPAPVSETRPSSIYETKATPVTIAAPVQKAAMPPVSRNVAPPPSAPMNSTTRPMPETPVVSPAMPQNVARSESRQQSIARDPAPVSLADSMVESADEMMVQPKKRAQSGAQPDTLTDWRSGAKPSEATSPGLAVDSRRASGLASQGLTVMSDLGAAPDFGNQLLSAKAAERSRSGRNRMIMVAAAAVVIAAGAGSYFWYAKAHKASATASISGSQPGNAPGSVSGAGMAGLAPNSASPNSTASNLQAAPNGAGSSPPNSRQANNPAAGNSGANNSAPGKSAANNPALKNSGAPAANSHTADGKPSNAPPVASNARQPNVLPMNIAAPTAPSRNTVQNTVAAPDLGSATPPTNTNANSPMMGTIISSSMPAAPPPASGSSTGSSAGTSVVKEAKLISSVQPIYPKMAALRGDFGVVTIEATVNEQGKVVAARAVDGPATLRAAATDAVSAWKYQPATLNGKPIVVHVTVKLMFKKN
jgi:TonB family protein